MSKYNTNRPISRNHEYLLFNRSRGPTFDAMRNWIAVVVLALISAAAVVFQMTASLPSHLLVFRRLHDFGHFPLYGAITLLFFAIIGRTVPRWKPRFWFRGGIAFVVAGLLGVLAEVAQITMPRDADLGDALRNLAGSAVALGLLWLWRSRVQARSTAYRLILITVLLLTAVTAWPVAEAALDKMRQKQTFPVLAQFEANWEQTFFSPDSANLQIVPAPDGWAAAKGSVARLELLTNRFSGLSLMEPVADWSGYQWLSFDVWAPEGLPAGLTVRIDDAAHDSRYEDRYNGNFEVGSDSRTIRIDLDRVAEGPVDRQLNLEEIRLLMMFASGAKGKILYVDNVRLEKDIPTDHE